MKIVRKIAMKCTRSEYESIKEFVGELSRVDETLDFKSCDYLSTDKEHDRVTMLDKDFISTDRMVYETFDKDVFLKACGINSNDIILGQVKEYFKDAVECVSVMEFEFNMKDYDLNSLHIDRDDVFIKDNDGQNDKMLYEGSTKQYAKIVNTTSKLKVSFNPSKNWLEDAIWSGGSSVTPEILRELTEPKNEAKRFKVGGIYKSKETATHFSALIKITKDNGNEIWAYGFHNGKFDGKNEAWYGGEGVGRARTRLQETTIEKWEKALLKYKK